MSTESVDSSAFYMNPCSFGFIGAEKQTVGARLAGMGKKSRLLLTGCPDFM